jgi:hypothetical protein
MKLVKVTKITESAAPDFDSAKWENFIPGKDNGDNISLPLDYEVKGHLVYPVRVGDTIFVRRTERNGVKSDGVFVSSVIKRIKEGKKHTLAMTRNSVYVIESLGE